MEKVISSNTQATSKINWLVPAGLILLSIVPLAAGIVRLLSLSNGGEVTPENARFFAAPISITIHIICSLVFCVLGAFQFNARFRQRKLNWHRRAGRLLMFCGLASALSGVWMTHFYPLEPHIQHKLLYAFRMLIGTAMAVAILLSLRAILNKKIAVHRAWIIRGYAIGQGAGTQVLVMLPVMLLSKPDTFTVAVLMIISWIINLIVAEWAIRKFYPR